jgi:hypothetical protein
MNKQERGKFEALATKLALEPTYTFKDGAQYAAAKILELLDTIQKSVTTVDCPFCNEEDFDLIGLRHHLMVGDCKSFEDTPTLGHER